MFTALTLHRLMQRYRRIRKRRFAAAHVVRRATVHTGQPVEADTIRSDSPSDWRYLNPNVARLNVDGSVDSTFNLHTLSIPKALTIQLRESHSGYVGLIRPLREKRALNVVLDRETCARILSTWIGNQPSKGTLHIQANARWREGGR
jgi:hypothetical protein